MLLTINSDNPSPRKISQVAKMLEQGGIIIYPTDTVYGLGCDIFNRKAIERICRLRGLNADKANLTFICKDISQLAEFTRQVDNQIFKLLKRHLPGPYTFILKGNNQLPKLLKNKRKTAGIRIPDNNIALAIVAELGRPILSISLKSEDEILEYLTDPSEIHDEYVKLVDIVIDGGTGGIVPSTVVDCNNGEINIIRQGAGQLIL